MIHLLEKPFRNPIRIADTCYGKVRGVPGGNTICTVFRGIPYAKPPVGQLRWRAPQPIDAWEGVRDCVEFGAAAYQEDRSYEPGSGFNMYPAPYEISEDCLYLNIWTPAESTDAKLPVLFWTHGGGNFGGYGHELENDGEGFSKRGIILVTYNYRLNAFGYLAHPELSAESEQGVSGNYGLMDAIAAFKWVRANIANFGGDPDNITIGGQSAGSVMTQCLAVSPLVAGEYAKVLFHSGIMMPRASVFRAIPLKDAEQHGIEWAALHCCGSLEEMRRLPAEEVLRKTAYEEKYGNYRQVVDGWALLDSYEEETAAGKIADVPVICSVTADEGRGPNGGRQVTTQAVVDFCLSREKAGAKPVYAFRFSRMLPGDDMGAWHTSELFYMFETIHRTWRPMKGYDFELATRFADYWANFIRTGDPNGAGLPQWTPFTEANQAVMDLGTADSMLGMNAQLRGFHVPGMF